MDVDRIAEGLLKFCMALVAALVAVLISRAIGIGPFIQGWIGCLAFTLVYNPRTMAYLTHLDSYEHLKGTDNAGK